MSIKILKAYIDYCKENDLKPTFEALKEWKLPN